MKFSKSWLLIIMIVIFEIYGFRGGLVWAGSVNTILGGIVFGILAFVAIMIVWSVVNWFRQRAKERREEFHLKPKSSR